MQTFKNFSLQAHNSFNIDAVTPRIYLPKSFDDLRQIPIASLIKQNLYILGEGSNTLFCQTTAPVIIKPCFSGIEIIEHNQYFQVSAGNSENWHDFVKFCINKGIYGLENLILIPGSVGAAPVQNIGAYGVEVSKFIDYITWFDFNTQQITRYQNIDCQFSYRDSIFKQQLNGQGLITHVHFTFPKKWQPVLSYSGLNELTQPIYAQDIMNKVITLRQKKLPDPKLLPNAGSFFKNPIIDLALFNQLQHNYPAIPHYPQANNNVKLAAGWLIEQAGLKGYRNNDVGVHKNQALVLVNYNQATGHDIMTLAHYVQNTVFKKFAVTLEPEVRFIRGNE